MTKLENELIEKGYWQWTEGSKDGKNPALIQTTPKWRKMMDDIFSQYGQNVVITENLIRSYIMDLR